MFCIAAVVYPGYPVILTDQGTRQLRYKTFCSYFFKLIFESRLSYILAVKCKKCLGWDIRKPGSKNLFLN